MTSHDTPGSHDPQISSFPDVPELEDWDPESILAEVAGRRGLTVEQLRVSIRRTADDARSNQGHVSFEHACSTDFSEEELAHLERGCRFCERLVATINPKDKTVEAFREAVKAEFASQRPQLITSPRTR